MGFKDGRKVVASNAGSGTMSIFDRIEVKPVTVPGAPLPPASYTASRLETHSDPGRPSRRRIRRFP